MAPGGEVGQGAAMPRTSDLTADLLLELLWESKGTDLLLTTGVAPSVRVDGDLGPLEGLGPLTAVDTRRLLVELLTPDQMAVFDTGRDGDGDDGPAAHDQADAHGRGKQVGQQRAVAPAGGDDAQRRGNRFDEADREAV